MARHAMWLVVASLGCGRMSFDPLIYRGDGGVTDGAIPGDGRLPSCGATVLFTDPFTANDALWQQYPSPGYTISIGGGQLDLVFPAAPSILSQEYLEQTNTVDVASGCVDTTVIQTPDPAQPVCATAGLFGYSFPQAATWDIQAGMIRAVYDDASGFGPITLAQVPYDATAHHHLRLVVTGSGVVDWATSANGQTYTPFAYVSGAYSFSGSRVHFGIYTQGAGATNPGKASFGPVFVTGP